MCFAVVVIFMGNQVLDIQVSAVDESWMASDGGIL